MPDRTFSDVDVIRIYVSHLTEEEQDRVVCFFALLLFSPARRLLGILTDFITELIPTRFQVIAQLAADLIPLAADIDEIRRRCRSEARQRRRLRGGG